MRMPFVPKANLVLFPYSHKFHLCKFVKTGIFHYLCTTFPLIANCFKAMGHTKEHIKVAFIFIMHNNILSTISSAIRSVSAAGTKRAAWLLVATAALLPCGQDAMAQSNGESNSFTPSVPGSVKDLPGEEITRENVGSVVTVGRPEDYDRQFVLYNVGTGRFLNVGGYWGSHASMKTVPRPFWLQMRNEDVLQNVASYIRYPESVKGDSNGFATQFFLMNSFQIGSAEGSHYGKAYYDELKVVSNGTVVWDYSGKQGDGSQLIHQIEDFNFSNGNSYIEAVIDINNVGGTEGAMENILSVGQDITKWQETKLCFHLYSYVKNGVLRVRVDNQGADWDQHTHRFGGSDTKPITVGADGKVYVKITKDDIVVNDVSCVPSAGLSEIIKSINPIFNYSSFTATTAFTKGSVTRHYFEENADAEKTEENIDLGISATKKWYKEYAGRLKRFEATIDLTNCTGVNENVLSVGTDISVWGNNNNDQQNIHFYYDKGTKNLQIASVNNSEQAYKEGLKDNLHVPGTVKIVLDENGIHIYSDGDETKELTLTNNTKDSKVIQYLLNTTAKIQIGSAEGSSRSHASYSNVSLNYIAKGNVKRQETIENDGTYNVIFADGEYFEGNIDLSDVAEGTEIFALKANASNTNATTADNIPGLKFTYQGTDGDHKVVQVAYDYDLTSRSTDGWKRAINVAEGENLKFTLVKGGLMVNGKNLFPSTNLMPYVTYDADLAGQVVHFKVDKFGNFLLDNTGKFILNQTDGTAFKEAGNSYLYTLDDLKGNDVALFISSKFRKRSSASTKEGLFLAWTPYADDTKTYGDVGVFADRSISPKYTASDTDETKLQKINALLNDSRWHFEPVTDSQYPGKHIYRMYLDMDEQTIIVKDPNTQKQDTTKRSGKFYLQALQDMVLGNKLEEYTKPENDDREELNEVLSSVEAKTDLPQTANLAYWQLIPVSEYLELFKGAATDFADMLDYTYLLSDPDFIREDAGLTGWQMDKTLMNVNNSTKLTNGVTGESQTFYTHGIRIGYDHYSKKSLTDVDYTDDRGVKNLNQLASDGTYKPAFTGSDEYQIVWRRERNHARYMGFEVSSINYGRLYQEVTVDNFGWYAITCRGFSSKTKGAELFIQKASDSEGNWVSKPLHSLTNDEKVWLLSTDDKNWPYDNLYVNEKSEAMPLYNALVAMNDENSPTGPIVVDGKRIYGKELTDSLTTQVLFYVDKKDLDANGTVKLRIGVNVHESQDPGDIDAPRNPFLSGISIGGDGTFAVSTKTEWTVFDNFQLLFGGNAPDPHLVLNEDSTTLDYLDNSVHRFVDRPMNLVRTFRENSWNTIILPVNLSQAQFTETFGTKAKLAELDHLTEKTIEFETVTEQNGVLLQAYKPYIIYIGENQATGEGKAYEGKLYMLGAKGLPKAGDPYYKVSAPEGNFYASSVTLEANYNGTTTTKGYDFAHDSQAVKDSLYTYQGTTATDATGTHDPLIAFGTLCKTYSGTDSGEHALLEKRPTLQGAYVFNSNNMIKIHNSYGVKGFRCWFTTQEEKGNAQSLSNLAVSIDGIWDGTTTIGSINATNEAYDQRHNEGVYNLNGQKLRSDASLDGLPAGIYIVNGVKQSVR